MKYMLLFCTSAEDAEAFDNFTEEQRTQAYARIGEWAQKYGSKLGVGEQLQRPATATTVRFPGGFARNGKPVVTDGPFIEGKEIIGGFWIVNAKDLDEALQMAKEWPASTTVEVRPILERAG